MTQHGSMRKASDLFVSCLENEGVTHIFGLPGEENADFVMSLRDSSIRFILCRHEQAAAFMADTYGRLTGKPGVCMATLGPGATNLVTGVADANMDRSPLVALIGQGDTKRLHKESHQNMDAIEMFRPITKWARSINNADTIPEIIRKAFKLAAAEKPGACVIELPEDIAKNQTAMTPMISRNTRRSAADYKAVKAAVETMIAAKSVVILAGNGAVRKRASRQLRRLANKTGFPVVNTFMGKGAIDREDQHCLYTIGLQSGDHVNLLLDNADCVITIGYDLVEYAPSLWNRRGDKKIIHIDFEMAEVDADYPVTVDIVSDLADALWQINEALNVSCEGRLPLQDRSSYAGLRKTIRDDLYAEAEDRSFPLKPQRILNSLEQVLTADDVVLSDVGAHKMWVSRYFHCREPNRCLISNGFCSMGFALPGAIGAKLALPDSRIVAVCGDAGFLMNVQDLETARRIGAPFVCMIWLDGEYGLIKWKQQNQFDGAHTDLRFDNPDFDHLGRAFGLWSRTIDSADALIPTLREALSQTVPALVAIPVDYRENAKLTARLGDLPATL